MGASNKTFVFLGSVLLAVIVLAGWGLKSLLGGSKQNRQAQTQFPNGMTLPQGVALPAGMTLPPGVKLPTAVMSPTAMVLPPSLVLTQAEQMEVYKLVGQRRISARAAAYLVKSKIQLLDESKTSQHFLITFPDGATIDEKIVITPNQNYSPTAQDLEKAARTHSRVYNPHLKFTRKGSDSGLSTLEFTIPYSALPKEILDRIGAPASTASHTSAGFFDLVPHAEAQARSVVEPSISVATNVLAEHWKGIDKFGEEFETGKSLGIDAPLAIFDLALSLNELNEQIGQIGSLEDCAKNPTNPLTQKASQDPNYQHDVLDPLNDAKSDVASSALPRVANVAAGYLTHFLPFGSGAALSPVLGMNDDAINSINEQRIKDAEKQVVECDKETEMTAFGYRPMRGKFEYKYNNTYRNCNENGCNFNTTVRESHGTFELDANLTEEQAAKTNVGSGFDQEDGGFTNSKCHGETHTRVEGPFTVHPEVGGVPESAILRLSTGGEFWHGVLDSSQTCGLMPPRHETWDNAGPILNCDVKNVDMVKGGTFSGFVDSDRGHGTCIVELERK
jgi:hypothetical protein